MKKLLLTFFACGIILCLCGCENPEKQDTTTTTAVTTTEAVETTTAETTTTPAESVSETTTSRIGGFIVYDEMPEDGGEFEWEEVGTAE